MDVSNETVKPVESTQLRLNLHEPKWDQSTYLGRAKHFFTVTNPLNTFLTNGQLDEAKAIVQAYKWVSRQGRLLGKNVGRFRLARDFANLTIDDTGPLSLSYQG